MDVTKLTRKDIPIILTLEKSHTPSEPYYSKYEKKDLDYIFDHPDFCGAFGLFDMNQLIGWGAYRSGWGRHKEEADVCEICSIVVNKEYRRKGYGKKILNYILKDLGEMGKDNRVFLTVSPHNIGALILYIKHGFVIYDFRKDVYGPGTDRVYLELHTSNQK